MPIIGEMKMAQKMVTIEITETERAFICSALEAMEKSLARQVAARSNMPTLADMFRTQEAEIKRIRLRVDVAPAK